jgi:surface protein
MANIIEAIYKFNDSKKRITYSESLAEHIKNIFVTNEKREVIADSLDGCDISKRVFLKIEFDDTIDTLERFFSFTDVIVVNFSNFDFSKIKSCSSLFEGCHILEQVSYGLKVDTSNVTDMSHMFKDCHHLDVANTHKFNTSNVTNFSQMFSGCNRIKEIDLRNFDTSKAINMHGMFEVCDSLVEVNLSSFDVSNVTDMHSMFRYDSKLKTIKMNKFNTKSLLDSSWMFFDCNNLQTVKTSEFVSDGRIQSMNSMFEYCYKLKKIDLENVITNDSTDVDYIFNLCKKALTINVKNFDSYNLTMFNGCEDLRELILKDKVVTIKKN